LTWTDCVRQLSEGEPRIEVMNAGNPSGVRFTREGSANAPRPEPGTQGPSQEQVQIVPVTLQPGEDLIVGRRLREILAAARAKAMKSV
jgi:L-seryl-tRNA(Ser) seleniumtransferase